MSLCRICDDYHEMTSSLSTTRCEGCDVELEPSAFPLFIVSGASGVGKSTFVPDLIVQLPDHVTIDGDELYGLGKNFGWDVHRNTLLRFAAAVSMNNTTTRDRMHERVCGSRESGRSSKSEHHAERYRRSAPKR